jgi:hypothetical protein
MYNCKKGAWKKGNDNKGHNSFDIHRIVNIRGTFRMTPFVNKEGLCGFNQRKQKGIHLI